MENSSDTHCFELFNIPVSGILLIVGYKNKIFPDVVTPGFLTVRDTESSALIFVSTSVSISKLLFQFSVHDVVDVKDHVTN